MRDFPVVYTTSTKFADYFAVGATKLITVSLRAESGKYVCHTCHANKCEHVDAVRAHVDEYGTPEQHERAERSAPLSVDLTWVEL